MPRKLLNNELNRLSAEEFKKADKFPLVVILDNIRSQHNIGAAFRTCDAFLVEKIFLCGICAVPPSAEIHKAALGAENTVNWKYYADTIEAINDLKTNGYTIISIEQVENSTLLNNFKADKKGKYAVIFGNEVKGVLQEAVDNSDFCIEIPQSGTKHSLNVSVSVGIILWHFTQCMALK